VAATERKSGLRGRRGRNKRSRNVRLIAAGIGTLAGGAARAGDGSVDFRFLHYGESDGRTQVENPELYLQFGLGEKGRLGLLLSYDSISGASPTGASPAADTVTTASGGTSFGAIPTAEYSDKRQAVSLSYDRRFGKHLPSVMLSYSHESDYLSRGVSLVDSWELNGGRSTFHYGVGGTSDRIDPVNTNDQFTKSSLSLAAGWTQVLGPRDLFDLSVSLDTLSGYLTDPYKVVPIADPTGTVNVPEVRPDSRSRKAFLFKYGHYFLSRTALKTSYRYYWDDWSLKAHTLEVSVDQRIGRKVILTPQLRYYQQGSASFFAYQFSSPRPAMSSDYRLSSFWSWLAGIGLTVDVSDTVSFNVAGTYTDQTGVDRIDSAVPTPAPAPLRLRLRRAAFEDGEGEDDDDDEGGGGGGGSISPADLKILSLTAGFTVRF
jgi:hypothetical protein